MSSDILKRDMKILCTRSGNRCAMPDCRRELVIEKTENDRESLIGVMAHIKGEKSTAPRYDENMTDKQRNAYDNLIFVCGDCHKIIDDQLHTYTVEKLHEIKNKHEKWIIKSTKKEVVNVTFAELEIVTKYLTSGQYSLDESYTIIPPKDKIKKNDLSPVIEQQIIMGLNQVKQVEHYIQKSPEIEFGERLKQGFVIEYERLKNSEGLHGDDLFNALLDFASGGNNDFKIKAAGLTVLVYLFERCDVFEK